MTLTSTLTKPQYNGDGSTVAFAVTFPFWDNSDVLATHRDALDVDTPWVEGTHYNLTGGDGSTGTLTVKTAPTDYTPAVGETLTISSNRAVTQPTSIPLGGKFPSQAVEKALDQLARLVQQQEEALSRTIPLSITSAFSNLTFPDPVEGKGLKFESGLLVTTTNDIELEATNAAASATAAALSATSAAAAAAIAATSVLIWSFDTSVTMADPGTGDLRFNNATAASVTQIAISGLSVATGNPDISDFIAAWDDSSSSANKGILVITNADNPGSYLVFKINAAITDNTSWLQIPVTYIGSAGSFASGNTLNVYFAATGDAGSAIDVTTKGDIQTFSSSGDRLAVGTDGQELTPDSGESTGLKWKNKYPTLAKSSAYTVVAADQGKIIRLSSTAFTVTLPSAATVGAGFMIGFIHDGTDGVQYTLDPDGSETINDETTKVLSRLYQNMVIVSDGTNWDIFSQYDGATFAAVQIVGNKDDVQVEANIGLLPIPWKKTLVGVHAKVATAGTTGLLTVDVNKNGTTMLSTKITVDSGETGSDTAATPAVISVSSVDTNDFLSFDVDTTHTTPPKGLTITLRFV